MHMAGQGDINRGDYGIRRLSGLTALCLLARECCNHRNPNYGHRGTPAYIQYGLQIHFPEEFQSLLD